MYHQLYLMVWRTNNRACGLGLLLVLIGLSGCVSSGTLNNQIVNKSTDELSVPAHCTKAYKDDCDYLGISLSNKSPHYRWSVIQRKNNGTIEKKFPATIPARSGASMLMKQTWLGHGPDVTLTLHNEIDDITLSITAQQNYCQWHSGQITVSGVKSNSKTVELECDTYEGDYSDDKSGCVTCKILTPNYQSVSMQQKYAGESTKCIWQNNVRPQICPPFVYYYKPEQRKPLLLTVKNGKLYNSEGGLFDTTHAQPGHPINPGAPAAIFVMGFDGRIYASNNHEMGLFHHSTFFAGGDVAAAGEIRVTNGVITEMNNCSGHYRPSAVITKQAIGSLSKQGYVKSITFKDCSNLKLRIDTND